MDELQELQNEKARLLGLRDKEDVHSQRQRKIKVLKKEISAMKQPKYIRIIKGVTKDSVVGVGMIFKAGARKASPFLKQGFQNLAENSKERMRPRKVRKVKKRVVKRRRREERNPFFPFG